MQQQRKLGLFSGIGLCIATMIGAGVFLSAGFMAQEMGPTAILGAWIVGALFAMAGARAYADIARLVPRSGGEYRYLSELAHPAVGYVAGWVSLTLGFAAPISVNAVAASHFIGTLVDTPDPRLLATVLVILLSLGHAFNHESSRWTQNLLALAKVALLVGFLGLGLIGGETSWPTWEPPEAPVGGAPALATFAASLFFVNYAFSGWNTTAYAAEEFARPTVDVPRAMVIACAAVGLYYLAVNWIFVANLTPASAAVVMGDGQVTLGHVITTQIIGPVGGHIMSALAVVAFVSGMSAMIMVGPRIYAAMARDDFLPAVLIPSQGKPPTAAVLVQAAVAIALLYLHSVVQVLSTVGGIMVFFSATTVSCLFWARRRRPDLPAPSALGKVSAAIYVLFSCGILYFGFSKNPEMLPWLLGVAAVALAFYLHSRRSRSRARFG